MVLWVNQDIGNVEARMRVWAYCSLNTQNFQYVRYLWLCIPWCSEIYFLQSFIFILLLSKIYKLPFVLLRSRSNTENEVSNPAGNTEYSAFFWVLLSCVGTDLVMARCHV
jgi:hypothetical protein